MACHFVTMREALTQRRNLLHAKRLQRVKPKKPLYKAKNQPAYTQARVDWHKAGIYRERIAVNHVGGRKKSIRRLRAQNKQTETVCSFLYAGLSCPLEPDGLFYDGPLSLFANAILIIKSGLSNPQFPWLICIQAGFLCWHYRHEGLCANSFFMFFVLDTILNFY